MSSVTKAQKDMVKQVVDLQEDLNALTVDTCNSAPNVEPEIQTKLTAKQIADQNGYIYITPYRTLPAMGKLPEKLKAQHARDWEYVAGIYENYIVNGEPLEFSLCIYPGDKDCQWRIPCNVPVYVPRMVARHLEEVQKYHKFDYIEKPGHLQRKDDYRERLTPIATQYRGKFRPIGAFA